MSGDAERIVDLYERKARAWVADRAGQRTLHTVWLARREKDG